MNRLLPWFGDRALFDQRGGLACLSVLHEVHDGDLPAVEEPCAYSAVGGDVFTLSSIAAVVVGGVSLFGGRGSAVGAICGAFVLTLLVNVLFFANIDPLFQPTAPARAAAAKPAGRCGAPISKCRLHWHGGILLIC